jgi:hypothetical protein
LLKQLKTKTMTQQEIIKRLENITWLMAEVENTYVKHELEEITEAIKAQFNYSDDYEQEVKKVLNYAETMLNLDNIKIR